MITPIVDQPPPIPTGRRPVWEIVMDYVRNNGTRSDGSRPELIESVLLDMRERDTLGRERYGKPLTSGNGRDHLIDAYQECLDASVYLANELDEHGADPSAELSDPTLRRVQQLFIGQIRGLVELRALIKEREGRLS
jgi:hypothetical protein